MAENSKIEIGLKCQPCGKEARLLADRPFRYAFELAEAAQFSGWVATTDLRRQAIVVFCCAECMRAALTKSGLFRRDLGRGKRAAAA